MSDLDATPLSKQYATVNGKQMAYHEQGEGRSIALQYAD